MPAIAGHDYETAKALRCKGFSYTQIAEQTGIPRAALAKYAERHKWDIARTRASEIVSRKVGEVLAERSTAHVLKISGFADDCIEAAMSRDLSKLKLSELDTLASVADTFDRIARRTYGLDDKASANGQRSAIAVQVNINGSQAATLAMPITSEQVLDAELVGLLPEQGAPPPAKQG